MVRPFPVECVFFFFFFFLPFKIAVISFVLTPQVSGSAEIDFSAGTVGFWHSTGSDDLVETVSPLSASTSSNGADWHLGVLELPRDGYADTDEDLYFSGVYIESGSLTTSVSGPDGKRELPFCCCIFLPLLLPLCVVKPLRRHS